MKTERALQLIRRYHPSSVADLRRLKIPYRRIGEGCSRIAFALGLNRTIIIKFPLSSGIDPLDHASREAEGFKKLSARHKELVPKIYYFNPSTGVTVVRRYRRSNNNLPEKIEKRLESLFGISSDNTDWGFDNVGYTKAGRIKILDLGIS